MLEGLYLGSRYKLSFANLPNERLTEKDDSHQEKWILAKSEDCNYVFSVTLNLNIEKTRLVAIFSQMVLRDKENLSLKLKRAKIVFWQKINIPKLDDDQTKRESFSSRYFQLR